MDRGTQREQPMKLKCGNHSTVNTPVKRSMFRVNAGRARAYKLAQVGVTNVSETLKGQVPSTI